MTAPTPGRAAYEAYRFVAGGKSLVTGAALPAYEQLPATIQLAWDGAAQAAIDWQRAENANPAAEDYDRAADVIAARHAAELGLPAEVTAVVAQAAGELGTAWRLLEETRGKLYALLDELKTSASATHPSKKSEIEFAVIRRLQAIVEGE